MNIKMPVLFVFCFLLTSLRFASMVERDISSVGDGLLVKKVLKSAGQTSLHYCMHNLKKNNLANTFYNLTTKYFAI